MLSRIDKLNEVYFLVITTTTIAIIIANTISKLQSEPRTHPLVQKRFLVVGCCLVGVDAVDLLTGVYADVGGDL